MAVAQSLELAKLDGNPPSAALHCREKLGGNRTVCALQCITAVSPIVCNMLYYTFMHCKQGACSAVERRMMQTVLLPASGANSVAWEEQILKVVESTAK